MAIFAVTTARGPSWRAPRANRQQRGWNEHAAFLDGLVDQEVIVLDGPIDTSCAEDVALLVVQAHHEQQLRSILAEDPWAASGVLRIKAVWAWTLWLDGRRR
jgi:uncharacterized protein